MKTAGIIGGIGPESTLDYYRLIIDEYRKRAPDGSYPSLIINSIDLTRMLDLVNSDRWDEVARYLAVEIRKLAAAGADFGLLAANTPHLVFDDLARESPIPLISIVETACQAARQQGLKRLGLLGTRFTMQGSFYQDLFRQAAIDLITPAAEEQAFIHDKYMNELLPGSFLPQTRQAFAAIIDRLRLEAGIDGVILAGTELPLLLRQIGDPGIPLLDTTRLHVEGVVECLLSRSSR